MITRLFFPRQSFLGLFECSPFRICSRNCLNYCSESLGVRRPARVSTLSISNLHENICCSTSFNDTVTAIIGSPLKKEIYDPVELPNKVWSSEFSRSNDEIFRCSTNPDGKKMNIAVLLSGGVDSSVALRLLVEAGHHCTAFYLKIWFQEDFRNYWDQCPWEEDLSYASAVCEQAGVELRVVPLSDEYWERVVSHSVAEMKEGRTPNPDVLCNSRVKFGAFFDHIDFTEFDRVASGHYARVEREYKVGEDGEVAETVTLKLSPDEIKDQTYFLSHLTQSQLQRVMFPLGALPKSEVRALAESMNLPNKTRKDSQGICFLGKVKFTEFVAEHLGQVKGRILESESGNFLGTHNGFWFHTIGQRTGLGLSGGPWYVVAKDMANNVVFVSRNYYSEEKSRRLFRVGRFVWCNGKVPSVGPTLRCKVRHGPQFHSCKIEFERGPSFDSNSSPTDACSTALVTLDDDDQGLAPGQFAAFYEHDTCLGSGVILEALFTQTTGVPSEVARTAAALPWSPDSGKKVGKKKMRKEQRMKSLENLLSE